MFKFGAAMWPVICASTPFTNYIRRYVEIKRQLDATDVFIADLTAYSTFQAPLCPSSGAQEYYTVVIACGIWCCKNVKTNL